MLVNTSEYILWQVEAQVSFSWYKPKILPSEDIELKGLIGA